MGISLWTMCKYMVCVKKYIQNYFLKIINIRGTILEDECVGEEEESLIQSFICDETEAGVSQQYSSRNDPYVTVTYTNLVDEVKLVNEPKWGRNVK